MTIIIYLLNFFLPEFKRKYKYSYKTIWMLFEIFFNKLQSRFLNSKFVLGNGKLDQKASNVHLEAWLCVPWIMMWKYSLKTYIFIHMTTPFTHNLNFVFRLSWLNRTHVRSLTAYLTRQSKVCASDVIRRVVTWSMYSFKCAARFLARDSNKFYL